MNIRENIVATHIMSNFHLGLLLPLVAYRIEDRFSKGGKHPIIYFVHNDLCSTKGDGFGRGEFKTNRALKFKIIKMVYQIRVML